MLNVKTWTATMAIWSGATFALCVGFCLIAPDGWHARPFLELFLPGFVWLSPTSFLLGLAESLALGAYVGASVAWVHNLLAGRRHPVQAEPAHAHA